MDPVPANRGTRRGLRCFEHMPTPNRTQLVGLLGVAAALVALALVRACSGAAAL